MEYVHLDNLELLCDNSHLQHNMCFFYPLSKYINDIAVSFNNDLPKIKNQVKIDLHRLVLTINNIRITSFTILYDYLTSILDNNTLIKVLMLCNQAVMGVIFENLLKFQNNTYIVDQSKFKNKLKIKIFFKNNKINFIIIKKLNVIHSHYHTILHDIYTKITFSLDDYHLLLNVHKINHLEKP